ncbi:hypothetical protein ACJMK2_011561 [Sinanodonta woodiana]|uniref:Major facilitator superfamily (MFS) profile domain-containing protein n=1 Tax=Sinanodonta woodiana TaxID=1069815 RepID=A0ABD3V5G0_SINWO
MSTKDGPKDKAVSVCLTSEDNTSVSIKKKKSVWMYLKNKFRLTNEGATPVQWNLVGLVFISLFSSSFTLTFIFPFLPEMILGRKLVMLITIALNGTCTLAFGFTTNIIMAFITRFLTGAANGTVGTAKTVLYEISDNSNQAVGMSIIAVAWGSGIILGPTVGGYLASPTVRYPDVFSSEGFLKDFPYILPSLAAFIVCAIAFTVDLLFLPETLSKRTQEIVINVEDADHEEDDMKEEIPLNHSMVKIKSTENLSRPRPAMSDRNLNMETEGATYHTHMDDFLYQHSISSGKLEGDADGLRLYSSQGNLCKPDSNIRTRHPRSCENIAECRTLLSSAERTNQNSIAQKKAVPGIDVQISVENGNVRTMEDVHGVKLKGKAELFVDSSSDSKSKDHLSWCEKLKNTSFIWLLRQYDVMLAVGVYSIFSFGVVGYEELFTVWVATEVRLDGLGFNPKDTGTAMGVSSIPLLCMQFLLFPNIARRLGLKKTFLIFSMSVTILCAVMPMIHLLVDRPSLMWSVLLLVNTPQKLFISCVFSCTGIFVNNSVTPEHAGSVNGMAMTVTAISRTLAPLFGGSVFAWTVGYAAEHIGAPFDINFPFFLFNLVFFINCLLGVIIPEQLNEQKKPDATNKE